MKIAYIFSVGVLVAVTAVGAVGSADNAEPAGSLHQSAAVEQKALASLKAAPTFSDSTLRRPL